ncbi:hypothetical protein MIND_00440200 [Mycena indigotica]|uniref:Uncharacterized protein n=1 Tax=Mycena indigotica TaxID=2126181 RepID=A0A8H6WBL9_9AGAR|nr:uncharacterized protein MIND_00440200 [Mycena indigotica]KAF7306489.1 hypothetical protein MIND_00440200 [Mycena indigotica]
MSEPTICTTLHLSIFQKNSDEQRMGALMGGGVGLTIGFLFGSWSILQHGAGPRGVLSTLSRTMLTSAASFSFFLAIGSVIRSEGFEGLEDSQRRMLVPVPAIGSRAEGLQLMRARWEAERRKQS